MSPSARVWLGSSARASPGMRGRGRRLHSALSRMALVATTTRVVLSGGWLPGCSADRGSAAASAGDVPKGNPSALTTARAPTTAPLGGVFEGDRGGAYSPLYCPCR